MLTLNKFDRMEKFLESLKGDVYPEPLANEDFIDSGIESIKDRISAGDTILDIGCGHCYAMDKFIAMGANPTGITLDSEDEAKGIKNNHDVRIMDMSFLDFDDECFDGIWARHSLEHSIFPYYTLSELYRVLSPGGWIYIEVPAADTDCHHQNNGNHYSVLPLSMWGSLMQRVGFKELEAHNITFDLIPPYKGTDLYYRIVGVK